MFASARRTYESGSKAAPSGRELEAAALYKSARQLEGCRRDWGAPDHDQRLEEALRFNQRLWTFFQSEIAADDCALPRELRRNLLQLSVFVDRRTFEVMATNTLAGGFMASPAVSGKAFYLRTRTHLYRVESL